MTENDALGGMRGDSDFGAGTRSGYRLDEHRVELLDSTKDLATGNNPYRELILGDGGGTELDALAADDAGPVDVSLPHPVIEHPPLAG